MHMLFRFDGYELKPIASYGYGHGVPLKEPGSVGLAKDPREILSPEFAKFCFFNQDLKNQVMETKRPMHRWIDRNGDGLLQGEELTVWTPGWEPGSPALRGKLRGRRLHPLGAGLQVHLPRARSRPGPRTASRSIRTRRASSRCS